MPWVGVAEEVGEDRVREALASLGLEVTRVQGLLELETSRGWLKFRVYEVRGSVEGVAQVLAENLGAAAFESGPHLVLGEVSARLWDEGARVVFPDGYSEVIPLFTYDGFLDVRMPTRRVSGASATMVIGGRTYELPLRYSDLVEIYAMGEKAVEKVEKAASVYGLEKVISREALEELRRRRGEVLVEVDYESGLVMIREGARLRVVSLAKYFVELARRSDHERLKELWEKAPEASKEQLRRALEEEYAAAKLVGDDKRVKAVREAAEKLGLPLREPH